MRRTTVLVAAVLVCAAVGCRPGAPGPRPAAPQQPQAQPQQQPAPQPVLDKTHFILASQNLFSPAVLVKVDGLPPDALYGGTYQFVEIGGVQGVAPPAGPYYLIWGGVTRQDGSSVGGGGDPTNGPFVEKQLGAGTRLTNVTPIGTFQAKSKGFMGRGIGNTTSLTPMNYTLFEATVQR